LNTDNESLPIPFALIIVDKFGIGREQSCPVFPFVCCSEYERLIVQRRADIVYNFSAPVKNL